MATKNNPGEFDCYEKADPDEPLFVLLGHDLAAPHAVRSWCERRLATGKNKRDDLQITEALDCAEAMEEWFNKDITQTVHILRAGWAVCNFTAAMPCDWPAGHAWVGEGDVFDRAKVNCPQCLDTVATEGNVSHGTTEEK